MEMFTLAVNKSYERCCGGLHEFCNVGEAICAATNGSF
jgi:hypothetical protein